MTANLNLNPIEATSSIPEQKKETAYPGKNSQLEM